MNTRRKIVSAEEDALFRAALKDARPLKKPPKLAREPPKRVRVIASSPHFPREPAYNEQPAPVIGGHADAHLRRGRMEPDARLDLHGMTQERAYRSLLGFLVRAQADGMKLVLVITGKGGILRSNLPLWLGQSDLKPLVAGLNQAHARHGGGGAFYVALRKPKSSR